MKKLILLILVINISVLGVFAQNGSKTKRPALPNNLGKYADEYPVKLMKVTAVKTRLKTLLGKKYATFDSYLPFSLR